MSATFEKLGTGFLFTEGPLWHPTGKFLLWSDMPGDHLRRWSARDGVTTFRKPCSMSNGLTYDRQGRLLACEHASSQVTRTETDGRIVPIAMPASSSTAPTTSSASRTAASISPIPRTAARSSTASSGPRS